MNRCFSPCRKLESDARCVISPCSTTRALATPRDARQQCHTRTIGGMGAKKKQAKQTKRAPVAVAADDGADDALLDAMIAANLQAAAAAEEEFVMAGLDLIAPGQFAREAFPGLASSCAMCGRAAAALPCTHCKLRLYATEGSNTGVADPRQVCCSHA